LTEGEARPLVNYATDFLPLLALLEKPFIKLQAKAVASKGEATWRTAQGTASRACEQLV